MDIRLIVTVPVVAYVTVLGLFATAQSMVGATFTEGQPAFLAAVGLFGPLFAFMLIWLKTYAYGAPLLVVSLLPNAWFVCYFFLIHDNPANVFAVSGNGAAASLAIGRRGRRQLGHPRQRRLLAVVSRESAVPRRCRPSDSPAGVRELTRCR